ncbi:MAG: hypothetical protein VX910_02680 [Candidatus Latescibacterota bacterium]|nr:hypothetical protein [Candidatus Latescibacterota bacterium]
MSLGIPILGADIDPYDVRPADWVWATSTLFTMVPVTRFDFQTIGDARSDPLFTGILNRMSVWMSRRGQMSTLNRQKTWRP